MLLVIIKPDVGSSLAEGRPIDDILTVECPRNTDPVQFVAKYCKGWDLWQAFPETDYDEF